MLESGVYTIEGYMDGIKNELDKDKWYKLEIILKVLEDGNTVVDSTAVEEIHEEVSDKKWIKEYRKWQAQGKRRGLDKGDNTKVSKCTK